MGMFDNFFNGLDNVLKDIEDGGLEKKLDNLAGMIDKGSKQVSSTTEKIASAPDSALKLAEDKADEVQQKVRIIGKESKKIVDILHQKTD